MNTKQYLIVIPLLSIFFFSIVSCQEGSEKSESTDDQIVDTFTSMKHSGETVVLDTLYTAVNNFQYLHHVKNKGLKPAPGDTVYYKCDGFLNGKQAIKTIGVEAVLLNLVIPDYDELKNTPNALAEVMLHMSEGDRTTVSTKGSLVKEDQLFEVILEKISKK